MREPSKCSLQARFPKGPGRRDTIPEVRLSNCLDSRRFFYVRRSSALRRLSSGHRAGVVWQQTSNSEHAFKLYQNVHQSMSGIFV
jgi:hypothetical protein